MVHPDPRLGSSSLTAGPVEARGCSPPLSPGPACSEAAWEGLRRGESMARHKEVGTDGSRVLLKASHLNRDGMRNHILFLRVSPRGKSHFTGASSTCLPGPLSLQNLAPRPLVLASLACSSLAGLCACLSTGTE